MDQAGKGARFVALHARPGAFVIPNPWDAGTAYANGRRDGQMTRDETLANARAIARLRRRRAELFGRQ